MSEFPPCTLIPGRFQPFHDGHKALIDAVIAEGKTPCVGVKDPEFDKGDTLTFQQVFDSIRNVYPEISIVRLPRFDEIVYGRNVGYKMRRVFHDKEHVAASDIREGTASQLNPFYDKEFLKAYRRVAEQQYSINASKGFWDDPNLAHPAIQIAKLHSEISEALECLRFGNPPDKNIRHYGGVDVQLSDALGILMGMEVGHGYKISEALLHKQYFNVGRERMHGGKEF